MTEIPENIVLKSVAESEFTEVFSVTKEALKSYVEPVYGWDNEFQYHRLTTEYQHNWYHWVTFQNQRVGLICFKPYEQAFHIHLLIIFPEHQKKSLGRKVINHIHKLAAEDKRNLITLSSFKSNMIAIEFYSGLGYKVTDSSDKNFVSMACEIAS
ncbi:GNAT family N-acetyltransferase [Vibrio vulnificus]|nr:GNAT family N-acetyltransferase [Vibrio parahaemolyticus]ELF6474414.1 GNAT family N-acetyltransferase [Vibrio vulnificus]ELH0867367.1 GNAT family N-acetyltransferase [Vibrio vulnificus]HAS8434319.1 GNAT family N-acetyltransferase [Vibrio vulnificus]